MTYDPGNGHGPFEPTPTEPSVEPTPIVKPLTIYINARSVLWDQPTITFAQVVEQWNQLDPDRHVTGDLPGIDWTANDGTRGIFYPSDQPMTVVDELSFKIDDSYLA